MIWVLIKNHSSAKNVVNILCKNLVEAFLTALAYWFLGYGLSREGKNGFIGGNDFFHVGIEERNSTDTIILTLRN